MTHFTEEYLNALYDEGYKARIEHGATVCPYQNPVAAEAWWDGYDRATEDADSYEDDGQPTEMEEWLSYDEDC